MKLILLLACSFLSIICLGVAVSEANQFIAAANRMDMVHDDVTGMLYVTNGDQVVRYNTNTLSYATPIQIPGAKLAGIDLSPDRRTLIVADSQAVGAKNRVHVIDTSTSNIRGINFSLDFGEAGTYVPAFVSNEEFLVSSLFAGSGWVPLRKVELGTGNATTVGSVRQATMLTPSADRSTVAYAESNISSGEFGRYNVANGSTSESGTGWFAYEIGVNRNGTQFAVPSYGGTFIFDQQLKPIKTIGEYATQVPIGVAYSPVDNLVYFAWWGRGHAAIDAYDTDTLQPVRTIDPTSRFDWNGNGAFREGRLEISRDGQKLFATVDGGVQMYSVPEPSSVGLVGVIACALLRRKRRPHGEE